MWSYLKVIFWGILWVPIGFLTLLPFRKRGDNCLSYALTKWDNEGGYLVIRWCRCSKHTWLKWPHFLWLDKKYHAQLEHIIPTGEDVRVEQDHTLPRPWFKARVVRGDPEDETFREN